VEVVRLQVTKPIAKATDESLKAAFNSSSGVSGMRKVSYGRSTGEVALHSWDTLRADSIVPGCALLESASSTYFVPDGWSLQIDQFGNAHVTRNLGRWKS
jgi:N-methylhydantoinase A/oxoprolinase/acetone carboxylase beta subunit